MSPQIVDDFSDGDLSEYEQDGSAYISGGRFYLNNSDTTSASEYCTSLTGLPAYPTAGQTFTVGLGVNPTDDVTSEFHFGVQRHGSEPNGIRVLLRSFEKDVLLRYEGDVIATLPNVSIPSNTIIPITVSWATGEGPSGYVFDRGTVLGTGTHGESDYAFISGSPLPNSNASDSFVHESGSTVDYASGDISISVEGRSASGTLPETAPTSGGIGFKLSSYYGTYGADLLCDKIEIL